jgi:uncharacterized protein YjbI with pentapeptide repeats
VRAPLEIKTLMRLVKPLRLSVLQRNFEARGSAHLAVGALLYFPFEAPDVPLPEVSMWKAIPDELGKDAALDEGMPKPRGELLVHGTAYAPGGAPRPGFSVRVAMAGETPERSIDKKLYVVGPREWKLTGPTDPRPITELRLGWEHAFGGEGYAQNPLGLGYAPRVEGTTKVHPLPRIEDPKQLVTSPNDRPTPAGLGALDITWPERRRHQGTYDKRWLEEDFPGLARDLDPELFMVAPPDQRVTGYLEPGARVTLENLHPHEPKLETRVPTLRARAFLQRKGAAGLDEVAMRPETLVLFPGLSRGVLLFRGVAQVQEWDARDVESLVLALERPGEPKPTEHYEAALARRLDKQRGAIAALDDRDLLPKLDKRPPEAQLADETYSDMLVLMKTDDRLGQRARAKGQRELDRVRLDLRARGIDPDEKGVPRQLAPPPRTPALDDLGDYLDEIEKVVAEETAKTEAKHKDAIEEARRVCAERGIDFDAEVEKRKRERGGPPKFRARDELRRMEELAEAGRKAGEPITSLEDKLADPEFANKLVQAEEAQLDAYRRFGHHFPGVVRDDERAAMLRVEVEACVTSGTSLAGRDLTGADLTGLDLSGLDLSGALLEAARLDGARLVGAKLDGAMLSRASLVDAKLERASLRGANLGEATLDRASFAGATLDGAVLAKCVGRATVLDGASLAKVDALWSKLPEASLRGVVLDEMILLEVDLEGACLAGASLKKALAVQCKWARVDLSDGRLDGLTFVESDLDGARFDRARAQGLKVVGGTTARGASFEGADVSRSNFRGAALEKATFERASCESTDFSEADLSGGSLRDASAPRALFMRTKLDGCDLTRANCSDGLFLAASLAGTRADGANLFRASLLGAKGDDKTSFAGAMVKRTLMPRRR